VTISPEQQRTGPDRVDGGEPASAWERLGGRLTRGGVIATLWRVLIVGVAVVNAVLFVPRLAADGAWIELGFVITATVVLVWAYLGRRAIPLKYLLPGTVFLLAFQVYPVLYTVYVSTTNYSSANLLTKPQAIERIQAAAVRIPDDAVTYAAQPLVGADDELALLLTDPDGAQFLGTSEGLIPVAEAGEVQTDAERVVAVGGYTLLPAGRAQARQDELTELRIPTDEGAIRLQTFTRAARAVSTLSYDPDTDTMTDTATGTTYTAQDGNFVSGDGERLRPGWRTPIGAANYTRVLTSPLIRGPFVRVFLWNYAFALLSVVLTFAVGLGLAIALDHPRVRGRTLLRSVLIIPYALPGFMTGLIWAGLLNTQFGAVNRMLGTNIDWLGDPTLAKVSILLVNLWLGFPYMFLISTGALQAIPGEVREAAAVDGASGWQMFRRIIFPLLLVSVAPLLIASFAFNFNNFNTVYLVTKGGPPIAGAQTPAGHTDILISYVYRIAFEGGRGADYGFASAIAVVIFLMVAAITAYGFRYTRALEDIN
jgi:arabinogalactan oligomer / maltooligosaccharide transport system permease protein